MITHQEIIELDTIYTDYGFEIHNKTSEFRIYLYKKSRYFGAEIVIFDKTTQTKIDAENEKSIFSNLGFASNIREFTNLATIEIDLFKSFFSFDSTSLRIERKYQNFIKKQTKSLQSQYQYIPGPYDQFGDHFNLHETTKSQIFESVNDLLNQTGPNLIIIEASAGYGKTCTAYEILNKIILSQADKLPIFTELARNRGAKIFRYILLDEIDLEFPALNSELVIKEIKTGRVPLIIDGFDELIDKVSTSEIKNQTTIDEVESMLDTIGQLLEKNTKIVLTTRKTAIFSGHDFDMWLKKWNKKFQTTRYLIKEPKLTDWIGKNRLEEIQSINLPIEHIANPVLLSFLKNLSDDEFSTLIRNSTNLIDEYFHRILERERERQNLIMPVDNQLQIFINVVKIFLELDVTSERKDFFKEILKEENLSLLEYTRSLYSSQNKPNIENLVDILSNHAILDRKGRDENEIGFINDFILGTIIGEVIKTGDNHLIANTYSTFMIELAVTAYRVQNKANKAILWERINLAKHRFSELYKFYFDAILQERITSDFSELYINEISFYNVDFTTNNLNSTVFVRCLFKRCQFNKNNLNGVSFIFCEFDSSIEINNEYFDNNEEGLITIKCNFNNCNIVKIIDFSDSEKNEIENLKKQVLTAVLRISTTRKNHVSHLANLFPKSNRKLITKIIEQLVDNDLILLNGNHVIPNHNKMVEIKSITQS